MAKKNGNDDDQQQEDGPTKGHNLTQITDAINAGFAEIYQLEDEIAIAEAKHIAHLKESRTKKWRGLKKDTSVTRKVLSAHYKLFKMAKDAEQDEEAGPDTLDGMRIAFEALQKNETLDWLQAVEVVHPEGGAPGFVREAESAA